MVFHLQGTSWASCDNVDFNSAAGSFSLNTNTAPYACPNTPFAGATASSLIGYGTDALSGKLYGFTPSGYFVGYGNEVHWLVTVCGNQTAAPVVGPNNSSALQLSPQVPATLSDGGDLDNCIWAWTDGNVGYISLGGPGGAPCPGGGNNNVTALTLSPWNTGDPSNPTPTPSPSASATASSSPTSSATGSGSASMSTTATATGTATSSGTAGATPSITSTATWTSSTTGTASVSPSASVSSSVTPTSTATASGTGTRAAVAPPGPEFGPMLELGIGVGGVVGLGVSVAVSYALCCRKKKAGGGGNGGDDGSDGSDDGGKARRRSQKSSKNAPNDDEEAAPMVSTYEAPSIPAVVPAVVAPAAAAPPAAATVRPSSGNPFGPAPTAPAPPAAGGFDLFSGGGLDKFALATPLMGSDS